MKDRHISAQTLVHDSWHYQVLSRANLEAATATQVKGKVENILEHKSRVSCLPPA